MSYRLLLLGLLLAAMAGCGGTASPPPGGAGMGGGPPGSAEKVWVHKGFPKRPGYEYIAEAAFSPDGKRLLVRYDSRSDLDVPDPYSLEMWELEAEKPLWVLKQKQLDAMLFAWLPDSKRFVAKAKDQLVLCDGADGKVIRVLSPDGDKVNCLAASPDGRGLVVGGRDGLLRLLGLPAGGPIRDFSPALDPSLAAFAARGRRLLVAGRPVVGSRNSLLLLEPQTGKTVRAFSAEDRWWSPAFAVSADGRMAAVCQTPPGQRRRELVLLEMERGKEVRRLDCQDYWAGFSGPDHLLTYLQGERRLSRWELKSGKRLWSVKLDSEPRGAYALSPDGKVFLTTKGVISPQGAINQYPVQLLFWDAATGKHLRTLTGASLK